MHENSDTQRLEDVVTDMLQQFAKAQGVNAGVQIPKRFVQRLGETLGGIIESDRRGELTEEQKAVFTDQLKHFLNMLNNDISQTKASFPYVSKAVRSYNEKHADAQFEESSVLMIASNIALESANDSQIEANVREIVNNIFSDADMIIQTGAIYGIIDILKSAAHEFQAYKKKAVSHADTVEKRQNAENSGALMSLHNKLTFFSSDNLRSAFTGMSLKLVQANGSLIDLCNDDGEVNQLALKQNNKNGLQDFAKVNTGFVSALSSLVREKIDSDGSFSDSEIRFCVTSLFKEMGIDGRTVSSQNISRKEARVQYLLSLLQPFESVVARMPNGSYYKLMTFIEYDADTDTAKISAPALFKYFAIAYEDSHPKLNTLLHADAANESNQSALEIANHIIVSMKQLGNHTGKGGKQAHRQIKFKFSTIINECPNIAAELDAIRTADDKKTMRQKVNAKLKQTFSAAYRIIMEKSDVPTEFQNLKFSPFDEKKKALIAPTQSRLDDKLTISWTATPL